MKYATEVRTERQNGGGYTINFVRSSKIEKKAQSALLGHIWQHWVDCTIIQC